MNTLEKYTEPMALLLKKTRHLEPITSRSRALEVVDYIAEARTLVDAIDEKRKELTQVERAYIAKVDAEAKMLVSALDAMQKNAVERLEDWSTTVPQEELQEVDWADAEILLPDLMENARLITSKAFVLQKEKTEYSVNDLTLIPREYLKVDEKKVKSLFKAGVRDVPGLEIYTTKKMEIRRHAKTSSTS